MEFQSKDGSLTKIVAAVIANDLSFVKQWVEAGGKPDIAISSGGWKPLHLAVEHEKYEIVLHFLRSGVDIETKGFKGLTALHLAVDVEADGAHQSGTNARPLISKLLLEYGADAFATDNEGETPITLAEAYSYHSFLDLCAPK